MSSTTLITGASSGIGKELARVFAREGHNLLLAARRKDRLTELKEELETSYKIDVQVFPVDLTKKPAPQALYDFTKEKGLTINILINNAGVGDHGLFYKSDWNWQETMIDLNMKALTHLTHLFLPGMIKLDRAYVMNVASNAAFQPGPLMSVYYATKHYVLAFSEAIATELKGTGVSVTTLCPGPTDSEFQETANMQNARVLQLLSFPGSKEVAEYGYKALMRRKRIAVHGFTNKIFSVVVRFIPSCVSASIVRWIQGKK